MKFLRDNQISSTILRVLFGNSSEKVPFFRTRPEGDPNNTRKKIEKVHPKL